ncbi:MAG: SET domain-containing protein [Planctomycetota bacterium]|jgi:hypothetical protein
MIHPDTELRKVNETIGYGVFATRHIPKGTILYVKDFLEIEVSPKQFEVMDSQYQKIIDWFSYIDEHGYRIISWDIAKYVNHHCESNSVSTGYGFEIASRDIDAGEEVTDEYGIFNIPRPLCCCCGSSNCRQVITKNDWDTCGGIWDKRAKESLKHFGRVAQPLLAYMEAETHQNLMQYLNTRRGYRSLLSLRATESESKEMIG